jgi:hypothetical protein
MSIAFERLTVLKEYRTPRYFRAFSRVYVILFGMLYAPCTWAGSVGRMRGRVGRVAVRA